MSLITRFNGAFKAFASEATGTFRTVFGSTTQSDTITDNITDDFKLGWEIVGTNDSPTLQDFNAMGYTLSQVLAYLHQVGIIEWNGTDGVIGGQDYYANKSYVGYGGDIYLALLDSGGSAEARIPTNATYWKKVSSSTLDISSLTAKTTPVDTDLLVVSDSAASFLNKKLTWANLKAALPESSETVKGIIEIATNAEVLAGTDTSRAVTPAGMKAGLNASGDAPIYACRAWVNFNGTGSVAIRESGNVSSITDNGVGDYTVNFTSPISDTSYGVVSTAEGYNTGNFPVFSNIYLNSRLTSSVRMFTTTHNTAYTDVPCVSLSIFR